MAEIITLPTTQPEPKPKGAQIINIDPSNASLPVTESQKRNEGAQGSTPARAVQFNENPGSDVFREFIGRHIPSLLGVMGSYAGPLGGAAGSAAGEGLREGFPNQFGGPESGNVVGDLLGNTVLPGAINALSAPRQTAASIAAAAFKMKSPAITQLMDEAAPVIAQNKSDALDASLRGFKSDPELPDMDQVRGILNRVQQSDPVMNPVIRYAKNRLIFALPTALFGGIAPAAAVGSTLILGEEALRKLVKDPETAQMVIKAINTPGDSKDASVIGPTLYNAIRGSVVTLRSPDGEDKKATIGQDGRLIYQKE
jgi:hypothetical protein